MVEAQQMKDRGLNVVDMNLVLSGVEPEFIGVPHSLPRLNAPSCKPHGKRVDVMVATKSLSLFSHRRSPELSSPDD